MALVVFVLCVICCRNFTFKKGVYKTKEAKGKDVSDVTAVDEALTSAPDRTGLPEATTSKEWWL